MAAAVHRFERAGYGNTSLADILDDAEVTKGSFYYHFRTKEELAAAIIRQANEALEAILTATLESPSPMVQNLIRLPFAGVHLMREDRVVRMGFRLRQAGAQVSAAGSAVLAQRRADIVRAVRTAVVQGDFNSDIDAEEVGQTIWAGLLGTQLLAEACDDDVVPRLGQLWRVILAGIASPEALPFLTEFIARTEDQYRDRAGSGRRGSATGVEKRKGREADTAPELRLPAPKAKSPW